MVSQSCYESLAVGARCVARSAIYRTKPPLLRGYRARYPDVSVDAGDARLCDEAPTARAFVVAVHLEQAAVKMQRDGRTPRRKVAAPMRVIARAEECAGLRFFEDRRADEARLHMSAAFI